MAHHRGSPGAHPADAAYPTRPDAPAPDLTPLADADLVTAAIRDPRAFAPLYGRYVTHIYRYCYRQTSDPDLAADLTTQVFTRAIEALPRFEQRFEQHVAPNDATTEATHGSFRSWLFTIAHNAVIDHRRRVRPARPLDDAHRELADDAPGPEERAVLRDELSRLIAMLDRIPDAQRQIIELRLAGLTSAEIATTLSMTRAAVKSAQTRAYARLRVLLQPPAGSPATVNPSNTTPTREPSHDRT